MVKNDKYLLGMAGEFNVCAELMRRGFSASITYGNSKKADIIVLNDDQIKMVEVKTTSNQKWVLGKVPQPSNKIWCFVYFPQDLEQKAEYFIIQQTDLSRIVAEIDMEYREKFRNKNGKELSKGVASINQKELLQYRNAWHFFNN